MWVVLILALFGQVSEGILIPHAEHGIPMLHRRIPIMPSSLNTHLGSHIINPLIGRRRGMVSNIFEGILGGSNLPIDAHIDEPIERQGLDHGHVGDNCQHKQFGCDQIGYHCVQTAEHSYSQCTDGQSAHCHCKRGCMHKGFFIQNLKKRDYHADCRVCYCIEGKLTCTRLRRSRRCRRNRYNRFSRGGF
ncbi:uncharacterized protein LOC110453018 [Mizuhopecten yessoensis]|uniref:uncharacterized protein LOC110453018 n=1 Tax=Mizuhopecten yessoensis TaxID=6573 RepID=UPI000B459A35|nr:uncharacterized protein LOC110453018 [Mizuhopecten yessoensis]